MRRFTHFHEANGNISPPTDVGTGMHNFHGLAMQCLSHRDYQVCVCVLERERERGLELGMYT